MDTDFTPRKSRTVTCVFDELVIAELGDHISELTDAAGVLNEKVERILVGLGLDPSDMANEVEDNEASDLSFCRNHINDALQFLVRIRNVALLANADGHGAALN